MSDRSIEDIYPLSPMQEGMLFHSLYAPETQAYVEQLTCSLAGDLDQEAFRHAWQRVIDRHPILRTAFIWEDVEEPLQVVHRQLNVPLKLIDWRDKPAEQGAAAVEALRQEQRSLGFDLTQPPLMRLALVRVADQRYELIWTHHHALLDGWSLPTLLKEVLTFYEAFSRGKPSTLPGSRPYRDYIAWLKRQDEAAAEEFWRHNLQGFTAPTVLSVDKTPAPDVPERVAEQEFWLNAQLTAALQALARSHQLTMNTMVAAAWALLLSRYSSSNDVVFGATVSGRPAGLPGAERMVGLFINTLPVRARIEESRGLADWLRDFQAHQVDLRQFEYTPLVQIQAWSQLPRSAPLFDSIVVFENYPGDRSLTEQLGPQGQSSLSINNLRSFEQTNYPLTFVSAVGQELMLKISYDCRRFDDDTVTRMLGHLSTLLQAMATGLDQPVAELPMLTDSERRQLLEAWNDTDQDYSTLSVHQLFEQQAELTPDALAVEAPRAKPMSETGPTSEALTYAELNAHANQLAHHLIGLGLQPGELVGLFMDHSPQMIIALLGILKAGAAYLPLDPAYPDERLNFMIQDSGVEVLLIGALADQRMSEWSPIRTLLLDADWHRLAGENDSNPNLPVAGENVAYVIYTSGSTGIPKGIEVPHRALTNHAQAFVQASGLGPGDRILQFISLSFDAAAEEVFPSLISGATLVIPGSARDDVGVELASFCEEQGITILHMPAAVWNTMVDDLAERQLSFQAPMRLLTLGGDAPDVRRLLRFTEQLGRPVEFFNLYGPTETTITSTLYRTTTAADGLSSIPIGRPIANVRAYVLDALQRPTPIGVPGELYIGGLGVAGGYLGRPALTAERFIPNPFLNAERTQSRSCNAPGKAQPGVGEAERRTQNAESAARAGSTTTEIRSIRSQNPLRRSQYPLRLFRTGDRVRYLADGNLEFLGRVDDQVKIRGFRVEPGEIETVLVQYPGIREAIVLAAEQKPGDKALAGYLVADRPQLDLATVRAHLRERLPEHMVPAYLVQLKAFPLTASGKVDRRALPAAVPGEEVSGVTYVAPRTPEEEILAGLWAKILGVDRIGIHDNFLDLGGHSLLATRLMSRVREVFKVDLELRQLFDDPTIVGLMQAIEFARLVEDRPQAPTIQAISREEPLPLSFSQQRLWFLDQLEPGNLFYNIPTAVRLLGRWDVDALQRAVNEVVQRHEVLRTTFSSEGGKPVQIIHPRLVVELPVSDLTQLPPEEREVEAMRLATAEVRQPFDLAAGPLVRGRLLRLAEEETIAVLVMHHIVCDGWSMGILIGEIAELYAAFSQGEPVPLSNLPLQYADYASWQRQWLQGEALEAQLSYWKQQLAGLPPLLQLPTDRPRPAVQTSNGAVYGFRIPQELAEAARALSQQEGVTPYMTLLAAYQLLLHRYSGQDDIPVGSAIANRHRGETEELIGFFVNTLVLRARFHDNPSFRELLTQVRELTLGAYAHQDVPFELLVDVVQPERNLSHTPLFQAAFSLQNLPMDARKLPGLTLLPVSIGRGSTQFDMLLTVSETDQGLVGSWEYNTDLFDESTIERMAGHLQTLLSSAIAEPDRPVGMLPMLGQAERQRMLVQWNQTDMAFPDSATVHTLIEEQARLHPDVPAVVYVPGDQADSQARQGPRLTYAELNQRANQLAHHLRNLGVGPNTLVGIASERSPEMVVGILGILKAGGAYLPIDPSYPRDRIAFMIEDSGIQVLLTGEWANGRISESANQRIGKSANQQIGDDPLAHSYIRPLANSQIRTLRLDADWPTIARQPDTNPEPTATAEHVAYVIYTSGSTGLPKGTMLRHRSLCNLTDVQRRAFHLAPGKRVLQFSPLSFDASVWEIFMALRNGATLVLAPQETLASGPALLRLLRQERITTITLPPSLLAVLDPEHLPDLETVIAAGERCTGEIVSRWQPGRRLFNAYGPTETTVCASMHPCTEADIPQGPPIGRPISNFQLYVLDSHMQPVPVGVAGELHVGGVGLAAGYLNRPELTAERFVRNPFLNAELRTIHSASLQDFANDERRKQEGPTIDEIRSIRSQNPLLRSQNPLLRSQNPLLRSQNPLLRSQNPLLLYKTGDLVRYRADGNVEFLGRIDHQVKLRGFRIELGEVEANLIRHPGVREAAALVRDDRGGDGTPGGDARLVAYLIPEEAGGTDSGELRSFLRERLPEYMIPSAFVSLEAFPLTPSGKVDRKALPAPELSRAEVAAAYVPPRTAVEEALARICSELLGLDQVGIHDNFFELGGHSLLATQFISRLRDAFGVELALRALFEHPTIAGLAAQLEQATTELPAKQAPAITRRSREAHRVRRSALDSGAFPKPAKPSQDDREGGGL